MKKTTIIIILMIFGFMLIGCQQNRSLNDKIDLQDQHERLVPASYVMPEKFYRDIDDQYYLYASVMIHTPYQYPFQDVVDRQAIKSFYEEHHHTYIQEHSLDEWRYDEIYSSTYSSLIILSYTSKQSFFQDLGLMKALIDSSTTITIELNTVGETLQLYMDSSTDDILSKVDYYRDLQQTYLSVDFDVIDINANIDGDSILDPLGYQTMMIIDSFRNYQNLFTDDRYDLKESYFDDQMLVVMASYRSSSQTIKSVSGLFEHDGVVDFALHVEQISQMMTSDAIRYMVVISVEKENLDPSALIHPILHTHYLDGYLSEVPFYIKPKT